MNIGATLHLKTKDPNSNNIIKCRCKIIGKNDENIFIDYPINDDTKQTCFFPKGTILIATYLSKNKSLFKFKTRIEKRVKQTIPALAISLPNQEELINVQRRQFVRIHTAIDVAAHFIDGSSHPFTTVTNDISAGGMSIIIPNEITADKEIMTGKSISFVIVLHMALDTYYLHIDGEVIRLKTLKDGLHTASIKFMNVDNRTRQEIIRFCFEKQRKARKKKLI